MQEVMKVWIKTGRIGGYEKKITKQALYELDPRSLYHSSPAALGNEDPTKVI